MNYLIPSFLAGLLTVLAPCVLSLLPVILSGTLGQKNKWRPLVIALSLGVSVLIFTLALKATTALIGIHPAVWQWISGGLILLFGLSMLFPNQWTWVASKLGSSKSEEWLQKSGQTGGLKGAVLLGAALGPVFTTCSPTYGTVLAVVLPANFWLGLLNLFAYILGLMILLLAVGYGGQAVTKRLRFAANPNGWFKRMLGVILVILGVMIIGGFDKDLEAWLLDQEIFGTGLVELENSIMDRVE